VFATQFQTASASNLMSGTVISVPDALELPDTEALTVAEGDCDPDTLADCVSVGVTVRVPDILPTWLGV